MPEFKLVDEPGAWLENIRLSVPDRKAPPVGEPLARG
jgi:hypothetical protein